MTKVALVLLQSRPSATFGLALLGDTFVFLNRGEGHALDESRVDQSKSWSEKPGEV